MDNPLQPISGTGPIIVQQVEAAVKEDLEQQLLHLFACRALGFMDTGISMSSEFDPHTLELMNVKPPEYDRVMSLLEGTGGFAQELLEKSVAGYPHYGITFEVRRKPVDYLLN